MNVVPLVLEGKLVRLEPMSVVRVPGLCEAGLFDELWQWTSRAIRNDADMEEYVRNAMKEQAARTALPFVIVEKGSGKVVGSTRFGSIDVENRKTEIGWTWITPASQRTGINTETKLLMLTHAFEVWGCIRVEFKTDENNQRSRKAIARIGATEEGTLRNHMITQGGRFRNSVYFSIIESEWPRVKSRLLELVG
ncbi:MAG: GNAT family N-acetyltransferase [Acidobacteriota bacterium]|nr:MAG: GNAT family N-acetyltransferase [Acidobacteriota bacterium]